MVVFFCYSSSYGSSNLMSKNHAKHFLVIQSDPKIYFYCLQFHYCIFVIYTTEFLLCAPVKTISILVFPLDEVHFLFSSFIFHPMSDISL